MTLGRLEKHYRVSLSADGSGRKDAAAATLLHSQVRPTKGFPYRRITGFTP